MRASSPSGRPSGTEGRAVVLALALAGLGIPVASAVPVQHLRGEGPLWDLQSSIPSDADENGMWDEPAFIRSYYSHPGCADYGGSPKINPVHGALLHASGRPAGKIVLFNNYHFQIYDPDASQPASAREKTIDIRDFGSPIKQEPFCAGQTILPNGHLLIAGGNWIDKIAFCPEVWIRSKTAWASVFDASSETFAEIGTMTGTEPNDRVPGEDNGARYYPTCTPLPDGSVLAVSGDFWMADTNRNGSVDANETDRNPTWEILAAPFDEWDSQPERSSRREQRSGVVDNAAEVVAGLSIYDSVGTVRYNTFHGNVDVFEADGACLTFRSGSGPITIQNNIFSGARGTQAVRVPFNAVTSSCNVFWDNPLGHANSYYPWDPSDSIQDPRYCDPEAGDLTLDYFSPCLPPNSAGCGLVGALEEGCGTVSVVPESWARIKGAYR